MTNSNIQETSSSVMALCGGVGGAKLALGLSKLVSNDSLTIVTNTGDDFEHLGLPISPDLDTVMYTLAGISNEERGWGVADESWNTMCMLQEYNAETWFSLGDRDVATHLLRRQYLDLGHTLTEITSKLCSALGIRSHILPMSDDPVRTHIMTPEGELSFQHYFVRRQCKPQTGGITYRGIDSARPQPEFMQGLLSKRTRSIIICPSNPFLSIQPILLLNGVKNALQLCKAPVIAVSPIVAGRAIKGPAAKMMKELGLAPTAVSVAGLYRDIIDGFVLDEHDAGDAHRIRDFGIEVEIAPTVMNSLDDRVTLAQIVLDFSNRIEMRYSS